MLKKLSTIPGLDQNPCIPDFIPGSVVISPIFSSASERPQILDSDEVFHEFLFAPERASPANDINMPDYNVVQQVAAPFLLLS